jgi:ribosomal protein L7Ae-like RNA K-turn-binding protein
MTDKVLSMLSLATKAGKVVSGEFSVEKSVKSGYSDLVIVAEDASDNTKKMFTNMCTYYNVPIFFYESKEMIGHAIGKQHRASVSIQDSGFAAAILKKLENDR